MSFVTSRRAQAIAVGAIAILNLLYFAAHVGGGHADSTFAPTTQIQFCNALPPSFSADPMLAGVFGCPETAELATGAHPDITTTTNYPGGNLDFSNIITLSPNGQTIAPGGTMPAGTKVGGVEVASQFGLINGACNTALTVDFVLYNVALPDNTGAPRSSTNVVYPRVQGSAGRFDGWQIGSPAPSGGGTAPIDSGNGTATGASLMFQNYPSYLLDLFDPAFPSASATPVTPIAVYGAATMIAGNWIPIYFAQFASGALTPLAQPFGSFNANMGQPAVTVLNDPSATTASPGNITDYCTPMNAITMLLGTPSGTNRVTNPGSSGTVLFQQYHSSQRDTDQDGYENQIDTCPANVNAGNPRVSGGGDTDGDGIDNSCDTSPGTTSDEDGDGFANRGDVCPQVSDPTQAEGELALGGQPDKGPRSDGIGDACETGVVSLTQNGQSVSISLSSSVSNGRYMLVDNVVAKCIAGTDADGDGYCVSGGTTTDNADSGSCASAVPPNCATRHSQWTGANHPALQMDTDHDYFSDAIETYLGTDPTKSCAQVATANNEAPLDNWPLDLNDDRLSGGADVVSFGPVFNKSVAAVGPRRDFNVDGLVGGADVLSYSQAFSKRCGSVGTGTNLGIPDWSQQ
jgi:Thrombospondin type 3 repeat